MIEQELISAYEQLKSQARKALLASSTMDVISRNRRQEKRTVQLYLHTGEYYISGFSPRRRGAVPIPLPYADESRPLQRLAVRVDVRLTEWVEAVMVRSGLMRTRKPIAAAFTASNLAEEIFGPPSMTAA